jgi:hypothetical protein
MPLEAYLQARNALIKYNLLAFDGTIFQVLDLPDTPPAPKPRCSGIDGLVGNMLKEVPAG